MSNHLAKVPPIPFPQPPQPEPPHYYTDSMVVSLMSPYSISIAVNRVVGVTDDNKNMFKRECVLSMSPQHMKSLWLMLGRQVAVFEERLGEISLPQQEEEKRA